MIITVAPGLSPGLPRQPLEFRGFSPPAGVSTTTVATLTLGRQRNHDRDRHGPSRDRDPGRACSNSFHYTNRDGDGLAPWHAQAHGHWHAANHLILPGRSARVALLLSRSRFHTWIMIPRDRGVPRRGAAADVDSEALQAA